MSTRPLQPPGQADEHTTFIEPAPSTAIDTPAAKWVSRTLDRVIIEQEAQRPTPLVGSG